MPCSALWAYLKLLRLTKKYERENLTIADIFQIQVKQSPNKYAIISETQQWTFRQLDEFSNRIANLFHTQGFHKGDVVGLLLENRAEFVGIWLGLSKIGVITPLINTNQRGPSLLHSIIVAHCKSLIFGEGFNDAIEEVRNDIPEDVTLYQFNNQANAKVVATACDMTTLLETVEKRQVAATAERANHHDRLVYIYTSGTTGLPKAAVISHAR